MRALVTLAALLLTALPAAAVDFHVAPNGKDTNPGTAEQPFATLTRARDAVRASKQERGFGEEAKIVLHDGTWRLPEPLDLDHRDSHVKWQAAKGTTPVISGGRVITGLRATRDGLWTASIPEAKDGKWPFNELFVNGRRAARARFPNDRYLRIDQAGPDNRTSFTYAGKDLVGLDKLAGAQLVFLHDWSISRVRIKSADHATRTVTLAGPVGASAGQFRMSNYEPHPRYFIEDGPELLDAPGEWFLDRAAGVLTYRPLPGEKLEDAEVIAPKLTCLVTIFGDPGEKNARVRFLWFEGLTFEHCLFAPAGGRYAASQAGFHEEVDGGKWLPTPAAIDWNAAACSGLRECIIRHVGGAAVRIHPSCHSVGIDHSTIFDVGGNGIMMGSEGKLAGGDSASLFAHNNTIRDCGQRYFGCVGIWVGIARQAEVRHNEVSGMPYTGISVGWSWNTNETGARDNRIENNYIHHVMQTLSDGGGIYTLGRQPGTVLRGNLIHDIPANAGRAESNGMFIDEGSSLLTIEGNTIYRTARSPIRFHRAEKDTIKGNLLVSPPGVPTFRYNSTDPRTMTFTDNRELTPADVPALADGVRGQGLACDGATVHVDLPHAADLDPAELTASAWVRIDAWPPGPDSRRWIVNKNRNEWAAGHWGLIVHGSAVGAYVNIGDGKENAFAAITGWGAYDLSRWHHLAMTYDAKVLRVFLDGKQVADKEVNRPRKGSDGHLRIGGRADGYSHFAGTIDDVRLYKRALSAEELAKLAADPAAEVAADALVRRWEFDRQAELPDWLVEARKRAGPAADQ